MTIDFGNMPPGIDSRQVVGAMLDGLPPDRANQLNSVAMGGHKVTIDWGKVPLQREGGPEMQGSIYQDYPKTRFLMRNVVRPGAEMLGQLVGGGVGAAAGGATPVPGGAEAGGFVGATTGGTVADELMNKADEALGLSHPEWQPPQSTGGRLGREAAVNAAMVGGGKAAGGFTSKLMAPFAESVNPEVQAAASQLDIPLTAAQQSTSKLLGQTEQTLAKLPGSAGIMADFYAKTRARMVSIANSLFGQNMNPQIAETLGNDLNSQLQQKVNDLSQAGITPQLDPADVGSSVASDISDFSKAAMDKSKATFDGLIQQAPHGPIPLDAMKTQAEKLMAQEKAKGSLANGKLLDTLKDFTPVAVRPSGMLGTVSATRTVPQILNLRSALGEAAAEREAAFQTTQPGTKFMGDSVSGAYKSMVNALDQDVMNAPGGEDFANQYAAARDAHKQMLDTMGNPYIRSILSADQPEKVIDLAVRKGDVSNLSSLQGMLSPETNEQLGNAFRNKLIESAQNADGQFLPQKLAQQIKAYGEPTITQALGKDGLANLKKLATLSDGSFTDPGFRQFISQIGRKNGQNVSSFLLGASPQNINRVRALIGEPAFAEAQDGMMHDLLTNNQDNIDFAGLGKRLSQIPPESLATAIPPDKLATLQKLATVGTGIQASQKEFLNPSQTMPMMGSFWILRNLFYSPYNALKVLGGMAGATESYLTKSGTKYLTQGIPGAKTAAALASGAVKMGTSIAGGMLENPYHRRTQK